MQPFKDSLPMADQGQQQQRPDEQMLDNRMRDIRRKLLVLSGKGGVGKSIVENMSGLDCPSCGHHIDLFKRGGGEALAAEMNVPFLGQIPIDPEIVTMGDSGTPLLRDGPPSPAATAFSQLVDAILAADEPA